MVTQAPFPNKVSCLVSTCVSLDSSFLSVRQEPSFGPGKGLPATEAVIKTIPKKKKRNKAKWLTEEALQITDKRRKVKGKGGKERYTHLNAEFQSLARRDKKAFLSNQCKEIEEKNRMGKTRDLFKKIRDPKGTFHAKMGSIKDRNGMDLTEAEDIKKRWQGYTEELYKIICS